MEITLFWNTFQIDTEMHTMVLKNIPSFVYIVTSHYRHLVYIYIYKGRDIFLKAHLWKMYAKIANSSC